MFYYPRFSYRCPKYAVPVHVLGMTVVRGTVRGYGVVQAGWVYRVGTQVGNTGVQHQGPEDTKRSRYQRSGPRKPLQGGWSGWVSAQRTPGPPTQPPTLRARSVHPVALPVAGWALRRLLANKGEIPPYL